MKNLQITGFIIILFSVMGMAISCSTTGAVWDESTPPEQSAKIYFAYMKPTAYNGILFDPKDGKVGIGCNYIYTFPAGKVDFSGDVDWEGSGGYNTTLTFKYQNTAFTCNLAANEEYWAYVSYQPTEDRKNRIWGVNLYNQEIKVTTPKKENLIGFIPFNPPVISN